MQEMENELHAKLAPVQKRQQSQAVARCMARGLLAGAVIAVAVAALRCWLPLVVVAGLAAAAAVLIGGAAGAWIVARRMPDWHAAATAVDAHYKLQDRTVTALGFLAKTARSPLQEMQIADALGRLGQVDPRQVVPPRFPKAFLAAAGLIALAVAGIAWPLPLPSPAPEPEPVAAAPKVPKPSTSQKQPPEAKPPSDPAEAERLRAEIRWQPAGDGAARLGAARAPAGPTLRELASEAAEAAGAPDAGGSAKPQAAPAVVLEGEPLPLRYRQTIRRYFESIRPRE